MIAAGLSPFAPEKELIAASRLFLREIEQCMSRRESFSFETTLSGRSYLKLIRRLQADAWHVELVYLALPNKELSKLRVAERVSHGGYNIPEKDILRRFPRSLNNLLNLFSTVVDHCACFMNDRTPPKLIFENRNGSRIISDQDLYSHLLSESEV